MNKSKFNWGTGILIVIIIFMIISIGSTVFLMNQKVDLVENDYYAKGIEHQKQIDRVNRANEMDDAVTIDQSPDFIQIKFPQSYSVLKFNGVINFYRPSDSGKDFSLPLAIDTSAVQVIPVNILEKGYWKIKINWSLNEVEYYKESSLVIN